MLLLVSQGYDLAKVFFGVGGCPRQFVVGRAERCRDAYCLKSIGRVSARSLHAHHRVLEKALRRGVREMCPSHCCLVVVVRPCKSTSSLQDQSPKLETRVEHWVSGFTLNLEFRAPWFRPVCAAGRLQRRAGAATR